MVNNNLEQQAQALYGKFFPYDVADELPDEFIKLLRDRVKEINPDAYVLGEVWEDASNKTAYNKRRTYFTNAELDSVMNYPFRTAIINFLRGHDNGHGLKDTVITGNSSTSTSDSGRSKVALGGEPPYRASQMTVSSSQIPTQGFPLMPSCLAG